MLTKLIGDAVQPTGQFIQKPAKQHPKSIQQRDSVLLEVLPVPNGLGFDYETGKHLRIGKVSGFWKTD
jgi:hypothetical protein